jgi:hypothetical protein
MAFRDFSNFELGDDVYKLAGGLIPELIERAGLDPEAENRTDVMGELVGILGKNKVLRDNEPVTFLALGEMATYVERSGALKPLGRSLWTPDKKVPEGTPRLITGAVANWQDRTVNYLIKKAKKLTSDVEVNVALGNRLMDSPSEQKNPNVQRFVEEYGSLPTETHYAEHFVITKLVEAGYNVTGYSFNTNAGDALAEAFVAQKKELFVNGRPLSFVRVANAGVQLALQFRKAAQGINPRYDSIKFKPKVFAETDTIPVATSQEEIDQPTNFQAPQPALRQIALTAKLLHEATGGK